MISEMISEFFMISEIISEIIFSEVSSRLS